MPILYLKRFAVRHGYFAVIVHRQFCVFILDIEKTVQLFFSKAEECLKWVLKERFFA